jgi:ribosomal protein S8
VLIIGICLESISVENCTSDCSCLFFTEWILQFGHIVLTTSAGIMDHDEARRKNVGGKVLGFFY